jgi:hypothetical protein
MIVTPNLTLPKHSRESAKKDGSVVFGTPKPNEIIHKPQSTFIRTHLNDLEEYQDLYESIVKCTSQELEAENKY